MAAKFKDKTVKQSDLMVRYTIEKADLVSSNPYQNVNNNSAVVDYAKLREMVETFTAQQDDVDAALQMLPDLSLVCETLNASILSPKDFREYSLNLIGESWTPPGIIEAAKRHFTTVFNLSNEIPNILDLALCKRGGHVLIPISPKSISTLIREGTPGLESFEIGERLSRMDMSNYGFISPITPKLNTASNYWGLESSEDAATRSIQPTSYIEITDNWMYALRPKLKEALNKSRLDDLTSAAYGLEADISQVTRKTVKVYNDLYAKNIPAAIFAPVSDQDRDNNIDLNPIVFNPPITSMIVAHVPGSPKEHLGYYFPLDEDGNVLHFPRSSSKYRELNDKLNNMVNDQASMSLLATGIKYMGQEPSATTDKAKMNKQLLSLYNEQFERELCEAVANGKTGRTIEISNPGDLYRVMLFRQLSKQKTRILYIPASMVTYFAFNYNEEGIGESLLEKTKLYTAFRVVLTFATMFAAVKGSVNMREVEIVVSDDDPDPRGSVETLINEYMGMQTSSLPIASLRPADIIDGLAKSGIQIKVKGSPDKVPQSSMDVNEKKREITPPDQSIMDWLKDTQYAGMMVSPEIMDRVLGAELAVSVASVNLLQAKRVMKIHKPLISCTNKFMRTYIKCGGPLYQEIKKIYDETKGCEKTLHEVIDSISMSLPQPDTAIISTQIEAFDKQLEFVTKVVTVTINEDMISSMLTGDSANVPVEAIKNGIINLLMRDYITKENLIPEMDTLLNDADSNLSEMLQQHYERVLVLVEEVARNLAKTEHEEDETTRDFVDKYNPDAANQDETQNYDENEEQTGDDSNMSNTNDDGGELGSDDINFNSDNVSDDETATKDDKSSDNMDDLNIDGGESKDNLKPEEDNSEANEDKKTKTDDSKESENDVFEDEDVVEKDKRVKDDKVNNKEEDDKDKIKDKKKSLDSTEEEGEDDSKDDKKDKDK